MIPSAEAGLGVYARWCRRRDRAAGFVEGVFHVVARGGQFLIAPEQMRGHRRCRVEELALRALLLPRDPDALAEEECAEKLEALKEAGEACLVRIQLQPERGEGGAGGGQSFARGFFTGAEDEEIVGVPDQVIAALR